MSLIRFAQYLKLLLVVMFVGVISFQGYTQETKPAKAKGIQVNPTPLTEEELAVIDKQLGLHLELLQRKDYKESSRHLNIIALKYWDHMQLDKAIYYYDSSLVLNEKVGNSSGIAKINNNLGMIHADLGNYQKSYDFFEMTLKERRRNNEKLGMFSALVNMSVVLNNLKKYDLSVKHLKEALSISKEMNDVAQIKSCFGMLAETYQKAGQVDMAHEYFELYRTFHEQLYRKKEADITHEFKQKEKAIQDSLSFARMKAQLIAAENQIKELELHRAKRELGIKKEEAARYNAENTELVINANKKNLQIMALEQSHEIMEQEHKIEILEAERWHNLLLAGGVIVLLVAGLLLIGFRQKQKSNKLLAKKQERILSQKERLEEQNKHITQSITYAKRIQNAVLDDPSKWWSTLPSSFVFWRPRDIVSGDFYFYKSLETSEGLKTIIAAVDCTGHGVPGAFVSMLGKNLLDQISAEGIYEPNKILDELHRRISDAFKSNEDGVQDGMDMSLVTIDFEKEELLFAGARNPLVYFQENEMHVIKGDRKSIGGREATRGKINNFSLHKVDMTKETAFYLFSDGYQDQFGGPNDKRFMVKKLKAMFHEIHQKDIEAQYEVLSDTLDTWKAGTSQIDDILVLGVKFDEKTKELYKETSNKQLAGI